MKFTDCQIGCEKTHIMREMHDCSLTSVLAAVVQTAISP